jgi:AcrR family transcriptional regulator
MGDMNPATVTPAKRPYRMRVRAEATQATANRVLDVALQLFTDRPYDGVSLDLIAERAGITKRTVIRRFGSKDRLFVAAMARAGEEMARQRDAAPVGDLAGAVRSVIDHYERWGAYRLRMISQEHRSAAVRGDVEFGRRFHRRWVERAFEDLLVGLEPATRDRRVGGLVALTDVYTWKLLRLDLGMTRKQIEQTLIELLEALRGRPR